MKKMLIIIALILLFWVSAVLLLFMTAVILNDISSWKTIGWNIIPTAFAWLGVLVGNYGLGWAVTTTMKNWE